jgi:MOSC domain-containing protein
MVGTVSRLCRYPVKSMLGEDLDAGDVTVRGLDHDRRLAVVSHRTGKVASAKYPRLWRALLTLSAAADPPAGGEGAVARITLPDGAIIKSTDPEVDQILSALLSEPVTLTATPPAGASLDRAVPEAVLADGVTAEVPAQIIEIGAGAPPGTFVDFAPLHLLTTATLDRIAGLSPRGVADAERYRPNVVIRTTVPGFPENDWLDRYVAVGEDLILRVIARTPRCAVPTLAHGPLPRDADALRVLARHNRLAPVAEMDPEPCAGVYAEVLSPGRIQVGDSVFLV